MNEQSMENSIRAIEEDRNKRKKIEQLRQELSGEIRELEKINTEMKNLNLSEDDLAAMAKSKESLEKACFRKIPEIIPLLEEEISFYKKDLITTEKNLEKSIDPELTLGFQEQVNYLKGKIKDVQGEIDQYKGVLDI